LRRCTLYEITARIGWLRSVANPRERRTAGRSLQE